MTAPALSLVSTGRRGRDRLELLTALIAGPAFDPQLRDDVIEFPRDHPVFRWHCLVPACEGHLHVTSEWCRRHAAQWRESQAAGIGLADFLRTAAPLKTNTWHKRATLCRVPGGVRPAQRGASSGLCGFHLRRWAYLRGSTKVNDPQLLDDWLNSEQPCQSYGQCLADCCGELARSPLGLCEGHDAQYASDGRPGAARLPANWQRYREAKGLPVPVAYGDETAFRRWCVAVMPRPAPGQLNLLALHPLVRAELRWGLFCYTQRRNRTRWWLPWIQAVLRSCRGLRSLDEFDDQSARPYERMIVSEIRRDLQVVYMTPADTRDAGYLDLAHFGRQVPYLSDKFDLTRIPQQWLRQLWWDYLAAQLRSVNCPRGRGYYYAVRVAGHELGAFLLDAAPSDGQDPRRLTAEHVDAFVADHRHRAGGRLPSLRGSDDGKPVVVTEVTCKSTFDILRRIFRWALETGEADRVGLARAIVLAFPEGGRPPYRPRSPFTDHTARMLADETNLAALHGLDTTDRGLRDIWETIIVTGRRAGEVLGLRVDCVSMHNGVPLLWHDQTKVGNLNEAIRIPEYTQQRLQARQLKTLTQFEHRHGRAPTDAERTRMALFPARQKNPHGDRTVSYAWFHSRFRPWVASLDLGGAVPHQARHTLATRLLAAGASLHHIKRYLGHVSERMTEHYAKVALSEIDDILHHVWVSGPGSPSPGELRAHRVTPLAPEAAQALVLDLNRRSTPTEGGICTFQVVVDGGACPWKLDCHNCDKFVMTGADLLYWRRKRDQWRSIAERAPTDEMSDYLHAVFEPTARAIDGLERALGGLGLLEDALAMDMRRPQDYFHRLWSVGFRTSDLAAIGNDEDQV
ncbi:tyrosine-type recombinase/integrase [Micromonospora sp. DT228]|uniref:tyrosine-type recombinase/integrase n=1 Tax=Micromonospora sp. DT228 TaxID=3393443 RepID=UPI003CEB9B08